MVPAPFHICVWGQAAIIKHQIITAIVFNITSLNIQVPLHRLYIVLLFTTVYSFCIQKRTPSFQLLLPRPCSLLHYILEFKKGTTSIFISIKVLLNCVAMWRQFCKANKTLSSSIHLSEWKRLDNTGNVPQFYPSRSSALINKIWISYSLNKLELN